MKQIKYSTGLMVWLLCLVTFLIQAQDKTEKANLKIDLAFHQLNHDLPIIKVSAKTKKERKFEPVENVEINLFFGEESSKGFMGRVKTNYHGVASLTLPERFKDQLDSMTGFTFIGTLTNHDLFNDQQTELEVTKAKIELTLDDIDSIRTIRSKVMAFQDTGWVAQPETEIKFFVRRLLSDLSATEEESFTTDENGEASAEFNLIVPGDLNGNVMIGAKIDDHELYGNLVSAKTIKWGIPLVPDNSFAKRTLWSTRDKTPLWLLIFPNLIIATVWGIIFYLLYQIIRIMKLGKANDPVK